MTRLKIALTLSVLSAFSVGPQTAQAAQQYIITTLPTLGGDYSQGVAINASGQLAVNGTRTGVSGPRSFLYTHGTMTDLGQVGNGEPYALGMNDLGQVVGLNTIVVSGVPKQHPFLYKNGVMTDLGLLMANPIGQAYGINNAGVIAGYGSTSAFYILNGVVYPLEGVSNPLGINASGIIFGPNYTFNTSTQDYHPFYNLNNFYAQAMNNTGSMVGSSHADYAYHSHASLYQSGIVTDLGVLSGGQDSNAYGINNVGQIVGMANLSDLSYHAFVYSSGTMSDLNTLIAPNLGLTLTDARGINDNGQIIANAKVYFANPAAGYNSRAILLTPMVTGTTLPTAPIGLTATAANTAEIDLHWDALVNATSFKIYRGTVPNGPKTVIGTATATTDFQDTTATAGTYYYKIVGVNGLGGGTSSVEVSASTTGLTLGAPGKLAAVGVSASQINLTWNAVPTATSYTVFRSTTANTFHSYVATTTTPSYNDTQRAPVTTYYYIVVASNASGSGAKSAEAAGTTLALMPGALSHLTATALGFSQIKLTWTASINTTKSLIYRGTTSGIEPYYAGSSTTTSFVDTVTGAHKYYYVVVPTNAAGSGPTSAEVSATTPSLPDQVVGVTATVHSKSEIDLAWSFSSGATGYYIYRSTAPGGNHVYVGQTTTLAFSDTTVAPSTTYYYLIRALNSAGLGARSAEIPATTPAH